MKKLFIWILAAFLILSLTACDLGGLTGSRDGEEVALNYDYEQMEENLTKLKKDKGLLIEMTIVSTETGEKPENETITYAENANAFYFSGDGTEIMFDFSDESKCVTYEKQEDGTWTKHDTVYADSGLTREQMEASASLYTMALTGYLGNYSQFAGQMMKVTADKVAGRDCDKFTYSMMFMGYGVEYNFSVDKETGMCLKWEMSAAAGMEGSASVEYTCTKFESPYTITFPANAVDVTEPVENDGGSSGTQGGSISGPEDIDINEILSGATSVVYGKLSDAEKQAIMDEAKKEGIDVSFDTDGTMTIVDVDGSITIQHPDGSWAYQDQDGNVIQIGGNAWPENEFTALIPQLTAGTVATSAIDDSSCTVLLNWTLEEAKAYAVAVKEAGFNVNADEVDMMGIYTFSGQNAAGVTVSVTYMDNSGGIVIEK